MSNVWETGLKIEGKTKGKPVSVAEWSFEQNTEQAESPSRWVQGIFDCSVRSNWLRRARQSASEMPVGMVDMLGDSLEPEPEGSSTCPERNVGWHFGNYC